MAQAARPRPVYFPRYPLFGAFALVGLTILAAGFGRLQHRAHAAAASHAVAMQELCFEDRADGAVVVTRPDDTHPIEVITGQNGFLRGTLRGLARTRLLEGYGSAAPFRLTAWADGRLTLDDPTTGRHVELEAFGETNEAVFAHILSTAGGTL